MVIGGVEYDLIEPFPIETTPRGLAPPPYKIRVSFGSHTFTRRREPGDREDHIFRDGAEERQFCPVRYAHSLHLPHIFLKWIWQGLLWDH